MLSLLPLLLQLAAPVPSPALLLLLLRLLSQLPLVLLPLRCSCGCTRPAAAGRNTSRVKLLLCITSLSSACCTALLAPELLHCLHSSSAGSASDCSCGSSAS
jgi:hypothetical protein